MDKKRTLYILIVLSILLIGLFSYLTKLHYSTDSSSFCDLSEGVSCDIVNKSLYSEFMGIPVSIMGIVTFLIVLALTTALVKRKKVNQKFVLRTLLAILVVSVLFSLWLIYAELYLILSICLLCVVSDILILIALYLILKLNEDVDKNIFYAVNVLLIFTSLIVLYLIYKILTGI